MEEQVGTLAKSKMVMGLVFGMLQGRGVRFFL